MDALRETCKRPGCEGEARRREKLGLICQACFRKLLETEAKKLELVELIMRVPLAEEQRKRLESHFRVIQEVKDE